MIISASAIREVGPRILSCEMRFEGPRLSNIALDIDYNPNIALDIEYIFE